MQIIGILHPTVTSPIRIYLVALFFFFPGGTNLWLFLGFSMVPDLFQKSGLKGEEKPEAYSNLGHFRRSEPKPHYASMQNICTCITGATFHWLTSHMDSTHDCLKISYTL